jgi:hypothetical protein
VDGETLLLCTVVNAEGRLTIYTVWATTADRRAGPRVTRFEHRADAGELLERLAALVPAFAAHCGVPRLAPPAAAVEEGAATAVPAPDPAPAAGGGRRAARADQPSPSRSAIGRAGSAPRRSPPRFADFGKDSGSRSRCGSNPRASAAGSLCGRSRAR